MQRTAHSRNKWWIIVIYSLCCLMIMLFLLFNDERTAGHYFMIATVLLAFIYIIYQQFRMEPPLLYGPRECHRCHRIVYRQSCPYCSSN